MYRRVNFFDKNIEILQERTLRYIHLSKAAVNTQGERNESNEQNLVIAKKERCFVQRFIFFLIF